MLKKVRTSAATVSGDEREATLGATAKRLDQAAARHLIHKNKAARLKSRLARLLKAQAK
jgi:small subunit ribosomal protein S20